MTPFRDFPLRRKLLRMTLASSAAALALATGGFLAWDIVQARSEIREDVAALGLIVAESSAAPLTFGDDRAAGETLAVLQLRPRVEMGCLYQTTGRLFATYHREPAASCPVDRAAAGSFGWTTLEQVTPVTIAAEEIGTLYIRRELSDVAERLRIGLFILAGLLAVAFIAAFLIASRMQHSIASPLLQLADTARTISTTRDYSLRATPLSGDEVGIVVHAFNDMLDRIDERTNELWRANEDLEREIEERRKVEGERTAALERERDANRLKDEFLATLSHELRTPLNAVLGWARILRSAKVEPPTQERALESIERNALAQVKLIEDLLEISRIVTGKLRLHVRHVDLAMIIDAAVDVMQPAAAAKRIRLTSEIAGRPAMTSGDPDRLQQIVWNLLSNAVKFTPADGQVSIRLARTDQYRMVVSDSGMGIDPKFLPHMFEPFRQADGTASREHGGLGLGLAIAKQLVELHGGTIKARSGGAGTGAVFEVCLPSVLASTKEDRARIPDVPLPALAVEPSLLRNRRVLVVEDEDDARTLLATALRQYGADVTTASSAAEAMAVIERSVPHAILSDIGMAHEDGYALIRRIRARPSGQGGAVPAVAITAYASQRDRDDAMAAGYQAHVAKPFDPREVAMLVARLTHGADPV